jgi:hypothetical protein
VLRQTGDRYQVVLDLPLRFRDDIRRLASATDDPRLAAVADEDSIRISLAHLRGLDPDSTVITYGCRVDREPGDGHLPGFDPDPA